MGGEFESFWPESRRRNNKALNTQDIHPVYTNSADIFISTYNKLSSTTKCNTYVTSLFHSIYLYLNQSYLFAMENRCLYALVAFVATQVIMLPEVFADHFRGGSMSWKPITFSNRTGRVTQVSNARI